MKHCFSVKRLLALLLVLVSVLSCIPATSAATADISQEAKDSMSYEYYTHTDDTVMPYRLYVPADYDATKSYPVIIFLNGNGHQGDDNEAQLRTMVDTLFRSQYQMRNVIFIAPQCSTGKRWVETNWRDGSYDNDTKTHEELDKVMGILAEVQSKYSTNKNRTYVMGLSMGGVGTWNMLMNHADTFAAGIPVCGLADPTEAQNLVDVPIWAFHGAEDVTVPYSADKDMVDAIVAAAGDTPKIKFTVYETMNHFIWDNAGGTYGLIDWLLSQKLSDRNPSVGADYTEVNQLIETLPDLDAYTFASVAAVNQLIDSIDWTLHAESQATVDGYAADLETAIEALTPRAPVTVTAEAAAAAVDGIHAFVRADVDTYCGYQTVLKGKADYKAQYDRVTAALEALAKGYDFYDDGENLGNYKTTATTTPTAQFKPLPLDTAVDSSKSAYQILAFGTSKTGALGLGADNNSGNSHLMWNHTQWISLADKAAYEAEYGAGTGEAVQQVIPVGSEILDFQISYNPYYDLYIVYDYIDENNYSRIWLRGYQYPRLTAQHMVNGKWVHAGDGEGIWNYNQNILGMTGDAEGGPLDGMYSGNTAAPGRLLEAPRKTLRLKWDDYEKCYYITFGNLENFPGGSSEVTVSLNFPTLSGGRCYPLTNIYIAHQAASVSLYRNNTTGLGQTESTGGTTWKTKIPTDTAIYSDLMINYEEADHVCASAGKWVSSDGMHYKECDNDTCKKPLNATACTGTEPGHNDQKHWTVCKDCQNPIPETETPHDRTIPATYTKNAFCSCGYEHPDTKREVTFQPVILGSKILQANEATGQKLRVDVDFTSLNTLIAEGTEVEEYGVIAAPLTNDLLTDTSDPLAVNMEKLIALYGNPANTLSSTANLTEQVSSRIMQVKIKLSPSDFGKRIALIAYVKVDGQFFYSVGNDEDGISLRNGIISTSVMRVMKNILKDSSANGYDRIGKNDLNIIDQAAGVYFDSADYALDYQDAAAVAALVRQYVSGEIGVTDTEYVAARTAATYVFHYCKDFYTPQIDLDGDDFGDGADWD